MQPGLWKHIAVGVDLGPAGNGLSRGTERTVEQALWAAKSLGARVSFLHSTARDRYLDPLGAGYVIVGEGPREEALERMQGLVDRAEGLGVDAELALDERDLSDFVQAFVAERGADVVFAGKRSRAERDGRRLGRASRRLMRSASAPVWVTSPAHAGAVQRIVAATDFSATADRALFLAAKLAERFHAELHVVHAVPLEFLPSADFGAETFYQSADVEQSARVQAARQRLREQCEALAVPAEAHVLDQPPYDALRDFARTRDADLVVLGTAARKGLAGFFIGNTAEWLIEELDASLLAVPPA